MQIVIDIPERIYQCVKDKYWMEQTALDRVILDGKILLEHGRLIDADDEISKINKAIEMTELEFNSKDADVILDKWKAAKIILDNASTVIESSRGVDFTRR